MSTIGDPEDGPPGQVGPKLFDSQDHRQTVPPGEFPTDEPPTKSEGIGARPTLRLTAEQQQEVERQVYAHEHKRLAEALETITTRVVAIDAGMGAILKAQERSDRRLDQFYNDMKLWLFGDTNRNGIAQEVGFTRVRVDSLFPMVDKLVKAQERQHPNGTGTEQDADERRQDD